MNEALIVILMILAIYIIWFTLGYHIGMEYENKLTERIYDDTGKLLYEHPYQFKRLFSAGQGMVMDSMPMTVLSC